MQPSLVLAGEGPLLSTVKADVAERGLENQVRFVGHVEHAELIEIMACVDIVVVPSVHEGFCVTAAEALILGRPVVASCGGGLPEYIEDGENGMLVPPSDVHALARAIERVIADGALRTRLAKNGSATARQLCGVARVAEAHERFFARVAMAPRRGRTMRAP